MYLHRNFQNISSKKSLTWSVFPSKLGEILEWHLCLHLYPLFCLHAHDKLTRKIDISLYFRADMKTSPNFAPLTFRITTGTKNYVWYHSYLDKRCWTVLTLAGGCLGDILWIALGFEADLHKGTLADRRLAWDLLPGVCNRHPMGRKDLGTGSAPTIAPLGMSFPNRAKVGSTWKKELHLLWAVDVPPREGMLDSQSLSLLIFF